ncbi:transcription initiation factor TFIID subunit 11 [Coemansia asiatica]|uniref:Transcription initiation factor TFIID subunit 11 n=1 Tax=Coemansia asiatica TaxID=1052880 RepID=A0A9W7XKL0_9FUNG|nr:transcription initiation factor TFIID subunit 11 [Coemansia asiatica]KAJ2879100.1 transcription initiation factor TFIID subunit 11 [Coemansia asiatica]
MSSDQSQSASGASTPIPGGANTSASGLLKKKQRLASLTPAGLLRQKKRRGGGPTTMASARKLAGKIRSGAATPTKQRSAVHSSSSISLDALVTPGSSSTAAGVSEKRVRRGSASSLAAGGQRMSEDGSYSSSAAVAAASAEGEARTNARATRAGSVSRGSGGGGADQPNADDADDDDEDAGELGAGSFGGTSGLDDGSITLIQQSNEEIGLLLEQMTDEQRQRYEVYRRTALNKGAIKKLVGHILNQQISSTLSFVIAGFSKVFVGEIVELAVQIQSERGENGPLKPEHLREAYRLCKKDSQVCSAPGFTKRLF